MRTPRPRIRGPYARGPARDEAMARLWVRPFARWLASSGLLRPDRTVLDYGCGYLDLGLLIADRVKAVDGFEPFEPGRSVARERARELSAVRVFDSADALPGGHYDLVLVNSVIQYMDPDRELDAFLARAHRLLRPDGALVIADIVPERYFGLLDAAENALYAVRHGAGRAILAHLWQLASHPSRLRLGRVSPSALERMADAQRFRIEILPCNLTPSRRRYSAVLHPHRA